MKKILSLVLVVAMLLSVVPMTWAAEQDLGTATEPKHFASLVLKDSIAINFKSTRAWLEAEGVTKAEFTMGEEVVQTIEGIPAGDSELAVFSFTKLTPAQMAEKVTISYYAGETLVKSLTSSVLDYCTGACADENENPLLKTALVDMLNYGAAAMVYDNKTVDTDLQTALTTYASYATTTEPTLSSKTALTGDEGDVKWMAAGLNLKDSVTLRFKFSTPEVDGLTLKLTSNGQTWEITNFYPVEGEAGNYYAYFNGLNPAQLRQLVYGEFYAEGAAVSNKLTYSVESYAAADDGTDANLTALTKTLMTYGDSVKTWAYTYLAGSDLTYIEAEDVILYQSTDSTMLDGNNQPLPDDVVTVMEDENASGGFVAKLDWSGRFANGTITSDKMVKNPAHISFDVIAQETGAYYVWAKIYGGDSKAETTAYTYIDGNFYKNQGYAPATVGWQYELLTFTDYNSEIAEDYIWRRIAVCNWTEGETYSVRLRTRDGNIAFDQFVVTSDPGFAPHIETPVKSFALETMIEAEDTTLDYSRIAVVTNAASVGGKHIKIEKGTYSASYGGAIPAFYADGIPGSINFRVEGTAENTTYYVYANVKTAKPIFVSLTADSKTSKYTERSVSTTGWQKIGSYTTTENGEIIAVRLLSKNSGIEIDQFYVTTESNITPHEHTFDTTAWVSDATHHWHAATCGCTTVVADEAEHSFGEDGTCVCGAVSGYVAGSGLTYIEAEDVELFLERDTTLGRQGKTVQVGEIEGASGGKVAQWVWTGNYGYSDKTLEGSPNLTAYPSHISFDVKASADGPYYIWVKLSYTVANPSYFVYVDDNSDTPTGWVAKYHTTARESEQDFVWVKIATCEWTEGETYTVRLRARQGGRINFDQFLITSNSEFTPT